MSFFERWVRSYATPTEGLGLFRIVYAGSALLLGIPAFGWIGSIPPAFFKPPRYSLGVFFESAPSIAALQVLSVLTVALCIALLFGYRTRLVSLLLGVALVVGLTFSYSFGKINHGYSFFQWVPLVMVLSPWGEAFSLDAARRGNTRRPDRTSLGWENAWPVALLALVIGFGYFSAGLPKSLVWVDFDLTTHGARSWLVNGFQEQSRQAWLAPWFFGNQNPYFWEMMDLTAVTFEVGFLLSVLHVRAFRLFIAVAVVFHAINLFMLNINFTRLAFIYTLFLPWGYVLAGRWGTRLASAARMFQSGRLFLVVLVLGVGLWLVQMSSLPKSFEVLAPLAKLVLPSKQASLLSLFVTISFGVLVAGTMVLGLVAEIRAARRHPAGEVQAAS